MRQWMVRYSHYAAIVGVLCCLGILAAAATTYAPAPHYSSHGETSPVRYMTPVEGFLVVDVVTASVADQTVELDPELAGYLERIVYSHNGNDASWSIAVTDHEGVTLYQNAAADAGADPYSYVVTCDDSDDNPYGGVPFAGGLSIAIVDADDGTGDAVSVRLYIREAWRR